MQVNRPILFVIFLTLIISATGRSQTTPSPLPSQPIAIRAGVLVDPDSGTSVIGQTILVERGMISTVGTNVAVPAGATVIPPPWTAL